ncbi:MAG: DUF2164 domain-containing protein [Methanobacteriota archaeon]
MKSEFSIELTKERRIEIISEIKNYFTNEREEIMGDLAAGLILDFILEKLAPEFYNQGVYDSYKYMNESAEDLLSILK